MTRTDNDVTSLTSHKRKYLSKMAIKLHDMFELVAIPVFDQFVLAGGEKVVRILLEFDLHNRVLVSKEALVAITKVKAPEFDVLVCRTCGDQLRVVGDVHVQHRQLVSVQVEEMLQGVGEEYFDSVVEKSQGKELSVGRVADAENVIGDFQGAGLFESQPRGGSLE